MRTPKKTWLVRGCVGGSMYLAHGRGVDGEARWLISSSKARKFTTLEDAQAAAEWSQGTVVEVKP